MSYIGNYQSSKLLTVTDIDPSFILPVANGGSGTTNGIAPTLANVTGVSQTAAANVHYVLTNVAATTVTLPAAPTNGDIIWITVGNGLYTNQVNYAGSKKINGLLQNMILDHNLATVQLRYISYLDSGNGEWRTI